MSIHNLTCGAAWNHNHSMFNRLARGEHLYILSLDGVWSWSFSLCSLTELNDFYYYKKKKSK